MAKSKGSKKNIAKGRASRRARRKQKKPFLQNRWVVFLGLLAVGCAVFVLLPRASSPPAPIVSPRMLEKFPHDTTAFTQGLLIEQGKLYESTGQYGASSLRRVDLRSGTVEMLHALDSTYFGEGLAALHGKLFQLTWKKRVAFVYDLETFAPLDTLTLPTREGWGLTEDGTHLILSDGTATLRIIEPTTFDVIREITVTDAGTPVARLNELEYIDGYIYANVWQDSQVAVIDPADGVVVSWLNLNWLNVMHSPIDGADVLNGIAHDPASNRLYITGKLWPQLYAFRLPAIARND